MIILNATNKSLEIILGGAITTNQLPFTTSYVDMTTTATTPGSNDNVTNSGSAVTMVAAPAASTQRQVNFISVYNADTAAATVTVRLNNNSTYRNIFVCSLTNGFTLTYSVEKGWAVTDSNGYIQTVNNAGGISGTAGGDLAGTYPNPTVNIDGKTGKTTPVDADEFIIADSAASFVSKKLTWANLKSAITKVGTIATGIWNGTAIGAAYGGTGQDTSASTGVPRVSSGTWSVSTALPNDTTTNTQSAGDSSTKIATTQFVTNAVGSKQSFFIYLTLGNQTTTSNVAGNITELVTASLAANTRWRIEGCMHIGCNNTGGVKLELVLPTSATCNIGIAGPLTAYNAPGSFLIPSGSLMAVALCQANNDFEYNIFGEINIAANAGTVQMQFASGTNTQTSTIYQLGTIIKFTQIV